MEGYRGYQTVELTDEELADFYQTEKLPNEYNLIENSYYIIKNNNNIVDKYKFVNNQLKKIDYKVINTRQLGTIKPRNDEQELAIDLLKTRETKVKLIKGVYGSGKIFATA